MSRGAVLSPSPALTFSAVYTKDERVSKKPHRAEAEVDWKAVRRVMEDFVVSDITQKEFEELVGVCQNYLSKIEHGKVQIGSEVLLRISRTFGKSMEWLLTGVDSA